MSKYASLPFAPDRATLDAVLRFLAERGEPGGDAAEASARRAAFARYERASGALQLPYRAIRWTSGRMLLPTSPIAPAAGNTPIDRPALATENVGGLAHLGATCLQGPGGASSGSGILILPLADAHRSHPELLAQARRQFARRRGDRFTALATAFENCGAFVYVPGGIVLEAPIQLVWSYGDAQVEAVFPRIVVLLGAGARATVIERHVGEGDAFVCGSVEASIGAESQLDYVAIQQNGDGARVRMTRAARCEADARMRWHLADLGGASTRTQLDVRLDAAGARAQTSALFFNTGTQREALITSSDHRAARTRSDTLLRCAASDRARGRYLGSVRTRAEACDGDASLRADALVLSKRARIDVKPELEIRAHDIRASHAVTIGSLDEDALFYVQTRGIAHAQAVRMIALAFFEPAIARFPTAMLQDEIRTALDHKIDEITE